MNKVKKMLCIWMGHSNVLEGCFGYMSCARCGEQLGDSLGGAYRNSRCAIVGHNCKTCRANYKKLTWRDKLLAPNPLKEEKK